MKINDAEAKFVLKNLDYFVARFEKKTGLKIDGAVRLLIEDFLLRKIRKKDLN